MIALFVSMLTLGLVTSVHCISMCGPMVVSYALKGTEDGTLAQRLVPNLAYQAAKLTSYTLVGVILGAIGSAFNIDGIRPYIMLVAGGLMVILGLGMTGKVPWAAKLTPRPPKFLMDAIVRTRRKAKDDAERGTSSLGTPITFGLLTGLMPCAPLMGAQLAAAGTGSPILGGLAMLSFGIGTSPLMLAFGTASGLIPKRWKDRMMVALAAVVIVLGGVYIDRGLMRLGSPVTFQTIRASVLGEQTTASTTTDFKTGADGVVEVPLVIENVRFSPQNLSIPADKPVRLVVDRRESNACSDQLSIPQLGISAVDLKANGTTTIDLPASKAGSYTLTCGMGMMSGRLTVGTGAARNASGAPNSLWLLIAGAAAGAVLASLGKRAPAPVPTPARSETPAGRESDDRRENGGRRETPSSRRTPAPQGRRPIRRTAPILLGYTPRELAVIGGLWIVAVIVGLSMGRPV